MDLRKAKAIGRRPNKYEYEDLSLAHHELLKSVCELMALAERIRVAWYSSKNFGEKHD